MIPDIELVRPGGPEPIRGVALLRSDGLVARIEYFLPHQSTEARTAAGLKG